ncbi:hypothetical protein L9W80_09050 [Vibrio aestuarianus]|uniref:hypothetical protein n=1 Tax=Vibrio aestuarianus TaxID=28171 RepID=UPI00237C6E07|nr:hypothetical protein [Vibrio aestuarianus]MDE1350297.1 hypothetical protein [Vibrio aestuarianus]
MKNDDLMKSDGITVATSRVAKNSLLSLMDSGVSLSDALDEVGEYRGSYLIRLISESDGRPNTRSCQLAAQYNGCGIIKDTE